jgi:hypothetical protein
MGSSNMKKELCRVQEGKREAFYTLRLTPIPPLQPRPLNGESQFKDCNPTTSPHICLGICLDPLPHPLCFVQEVITKIQDVMAQVNGVMAQVNGR